MFDAFENAALWRFRLIGREIISGKEKRRYTKVSRARLRLESAVD